MHKSLHPAHYRMIITNLTMQAMQSTHHIQQQFLKPKATFQIAGWFELCYGSSFVTVGCIAPASHGILCSSGQGCYHSSLQRLSFGGRGWRQCYMKRCNWQKSHQLQRQRAEPNSLGDGLY